METIAVIGRGRVGTHLCVALSDRAREVVSVDSRTLEELPADADLYLIAVSDSAVEEVARRLPPLRGVVAHTSGSVPMSVLAPYAERRGVFYPLQTFTKGAELDYAQIPVFTEANTEEAEQTLRECAALFTRRVHHADSARRRRLHIASVFACNYANHMWAIADRLLRADGLDLSVLEPLIEASVAKLRYMSPGQAQTGPASRGDTAVVEAHTRELAGTPYAALYAQIAESIMHKPQ